MWCQLVTWHEKNTSIFQRVCLMIKWIKSCKDCVVMNCLLNRHLARQLKPIIYFVTWVPVVFVTIFLLCFHLYDDPVSFFLTVPYRLLRNFFLDRAADSGFGPRSKIPPPPRRDKGGPAQNICNNSGRLSVCRVIWCHRQRGLLGHQAPSWKPFRYILLFYCLDVSLWLQRWDSAEVSSCFYLSIDALCWKVSILCLNRVYIVRYRRVQVCIV
jgi:hypothetical protein